MFGSDLASIAFFMSAVGMGLGGVAMLVALEVGRRNHQQLTEHTSAISDMLATRLERQDKQVGAVVDRLNDRLGDVENTTTQQKAVLMEVSSSVEKRLTSHENLLDEKLKAFKDQMARIERHQDRQAKSVSTLKTAVRGIVDPGVATTAVAAGDVPVESTTAAPGDADGHPLDGSTAAVSTAPMPRQPVITDVQRAEESS